MYALNTLQVTDISGVATDATSGLALGLGLVDPAAGLNTRLARCADGNGTLTHLFFSDELIDIARAKAICAKCVLADECLAAAIAREEPWGVWGGELISNGRVVANKRPRGRPPKNPRPELIVDEVPIPPHLVA
jgi:WhiB family redox-sensing transcriptional regulator